MVYDGDQILSAGEDGFLEIWDIKSNTARERFQLSSHAITSMIRRPEKTQIACIESDSLGLYRISAWDYDTLQNIFTLSFRDPISYINYSAAGNFLIAARSGRTGLVFINAETGEVLQSPSELSLMISFAATGRSERNMIVYSPTGTLSYWDIEAGNEMDRFTVPVNMSSPLMFGNSRFFAGIDSRGLVILDAVTGNELDRVGYISRRALLCPGGEDNEFICLVPDGISSSIYRFRMNASQNLETIARTAFPGRRDLGINAADISIAAAAGSLTALGTSGGDLLLLDRSGGLNPMTIKKQDRIFEAAASPSRIAFLTEDNYLGYIPLDFSRLAGGATLRLENAAGYTNIAAVNSGAAREGFMLWQTGNTRSFPVIKNPEGADFILNKTPLRFPLRSAAVLDDLGLFLDSVGSITVLSLRTGAVNFSYSSIGSMDAVFLDKNNIILGRSDISGNTPFLMINIVTGETVPLPYGSEIGARVYRSLSGNIYAAAINQEQGKGDHRTSLVRLNPVNPSLSNALVEYQGEDTAFGIAEAGGSLASTMGGDGAAIYTSRGMIPFERGPGIPNRLVSAAGNPGTESWFVAIDSDGNVSWHDTKDGGILALFRLYKNEWVLRSKSAKTLRGTVSR
jgi:hypothetical protein